MKKLLFLMLTVAVLASCKKENVEPQRQVVTPTFDIKDQDHSLWILKGYYKNGEYVATFSDKCGCPQEKGFVLDFTQDTIPYNNGKFYTYYRSTLDGSDNQGSGFWMPVDSLFKGWPTGRSDYFSEYTIISANQDSLVVDDGTPSTSDGSYAVYMNRSDLLVP